MPLIFRGFPACPCQVQWIPAYEAELRARGILPEGSVLRIYQMIGGAPSSGGTHTTGGATDWTDLPGEDDLWVARQMGADATWHRKFNWDGKGGIEHVHSVLRGCPHNAPARYQYDSFTQGVDHGRDGLSHGGLGAPDTGPRPLSYRTWDEGIKWHHAQAEARRRAAVQAKIIDALTQRKKAKAVVQALNERIKRLRAKRDRA